MAPQDANSTNHSSASSLKKARNDSSGVSSLLAPEAAHSKPQHVHKVHCESCYCQDAPDPGLLRFPFRHQHQHQHQHQRDETGFENVCRRRHFARPNEDTDRERSDSFVQCALLDDTSEEKRVSKVSVGCQTENRRALDRETLAFRKDHYFECHSSQDLIGRSAPHKCVHKFTVNDRLMLEPINCDSFGASRCEICDGPMAPRVKKLYERELAPPTLNIGSGGERIEIKVPRGLSRECFGGTKSKRGGAPLGNSFALRYQKRRN